MSSQHLGGRGRYLARPHLKQNKTEKKSLAMVVERKKINNTKGNLTIILVCISSNASLHFHNPRLDSSPHYLSFVVLNMEWGKG
jgi:hypothetical protein